MESGNFAKVMEQDKSNLIRNPQFMGESFMLTTISMLLALIIVYFFLPTFSDFTEKAASALILIKIQSLMGIFGLSPNRKDWFRKLSSAILSWFQPGKVLKEHLKAGKKPWEI